MSDLKPGEAFTLEKTIFVDPHNPGRQAFQISIGGAYSPTEGDCRDFHIDLDLSEATYASPAWAFDKAGDPADNENTDFDGGEEGDGPGTCSAEGLPRYWVNTSNFNLVVQDTDFAYRGLGPDVAMTRTWNINPTYSGMFGNGWGFEYESTLLKKCDAVYLRRGAGQVLPFQANLCPTGGLTYPVVFTSIAGVFDKLTYNAGDYFIYEEKETRWKYRYDLKAGSDYRLTSITDRNGNTLAVTYNPTGTIQKITDAAGRVTGFGYDANLRCTSMTTPDGLSSAYVYDAAGNLVQSTDLLGTRIAFTYDADKLMTGMSADGKSTTFSYDTSGGWKHLSRVVDAEGKTRSYAGLIPGFTTLTDGRGNTWSYQNEDGRTSSTENPLKNTTRVSYGANGRPASATDAKGKSAQYQYDARGNVTKYTDRLGNSTNITYDANDNPLTLSNALSQVWNLAYDANGNLTQIGSPLGHTAKYAYDSKGQVTGFTEANNNVTSFTYDAFGNVKTITDPLSKTTTFGYDAQGLNNTSVTDPNGNTSTFAYDRNRRLTRITNPDGTFRSFWYDACASTGVTDENGNSRMVTRDKRLLPTGIQDSLGNLTRMAYDANSNLTSLTNARSLTTGYTYDKLDRLTKVAGPGSREVAAAYDANSNLTSLTDEKQQQTTFSYDLNDQLLTVRDPLGRTVSSARDVLGRVSTITNARLGAIGFTYDADGMVTTKTFDSINAATYNYDAAGNLLSVVDTTGSTAFTYNARNQVTGITYPDTRSVAQAYDNAGNLQSVTYPGGMTVTYAYNNRNRVQSIAWGSESITFSYDATGKLLSETRSNGTVSEYAYDRNGRTVWIRHRAGGTTLAEMRYTRDALGNIIGETSTLPVAPLLTPTLVATSHNAANQVSTRGGRNYSYDADGNLTGIDGSPAFAAVYDPQNRPTSITANSAVAAYTYNGLGQRVRSVRGGQTLNHHYDSWERLLFTTDGSGALIARYIYRDRTLVAMVSATGAVSIYHFNQIGSTIALTDGTGTVVNSYAYLSSGRVTARTEGVANPFTFVGRFGVMDEGNDLFFMTYRYYDAVSGRFLQKDPIGFAGGINLYEYVGNSPLAHIDPSGWWGDDVGRGAARWARTVSTMTLTEKLEILDKAYWVLDKAVGWVPLAGDVYSGIKIAGYFSIYASYGLWDDAIGTAGFEALKLGLGKTVITEKTCGSEFWANFFNTGVDGTGDAISADDKAVSSVQYLRQGVQGVLKNLKGSPKVLPKPHSKFY